MFDVKIDKTKPNSYWSNLMLPMAFIQIHKHEARLPLFFRILAILLWMIVVHMLVFKFHEQRELFFSYHKAAFVSSLSHIGKPPKKRFIFVDFIQLEWSL